MEDRPAWLPAQLLAQLGSAGKSIQLKFKRSFLRFLFSFALYVAFVEGWFQVHLGSLAEPSARVHILQVSRYLTQDPN